jgi:hypothetical protein
MKSTPLRVCAALANPARAALSHPQFIKEASMGIDTERDIEADMQIGPTDQGMVRIFIVGNGIEIPMDFDPDEAVEIAEEILAASKAARLIK